MMARFALMMRNRDGASAAEFAMVLPLLLLFLFGIIDIGRYMWTINRAEKAAQMGVRYAVVSDPVADVVGVDYVNDYSIPGGDPVPADTFTSAECTDTGNCDVVGDASSEDGRNATAFDNIVAWTKNFFPEVGGANVTIRYDNVGLGFSGDPTGPDVSPLTTIVLHGLTFQPIILFGGTINLPEIKASLTQEDGECSVTGDCGSSN